MHGETLKFKVNVCQTAGRHSPEEENSWITSLCWAKFKCDIAVSRYPNNMPLIPQVPPGIQDNTVLKCS